MGRPAPAVELALLLKQHGKQVRRNGKHIVWEVNGFRFPVELTPSDHRGALNQISRIKRMIKGTGEYSTGLRRHVHA